MRVHSYALGFGSGLDNLDLQGHVHVHMSSSSDINVIPCISVLLSNYKLKQNGDACGDGEGSAVVGKEGKTFIARCVCSRGALGDACSAGLITRAATSKEGMQRTSGFL